MDFDELERYANNPSRAIPTLFNGIEKTFNDKQGTLNEGGHPFPYLVDLVIGTAYGYISRLGDSTAKKFRAHARDISDLSKSMSDDDWKGVYGEPSTTEFRYMLSTETIERNAIRYNVQDGNYNTSYRKLVLPPDTVIKVGGVPFLLENPVEIRKMDSGDYQVIYDVDNQSVYNPLTTNTPEVDYGINIDHRQFLAIHLPMRQLKITEFPGRVVSFASTLRETLAFEDYLYGVRAFLTPDGSNVRREMAVIFNNEIFDPNMPTLVVDMLTDNSIEVSVPSVYIQNQLAIGRISILIYSTKGVYNKDLTTVKTQDHVVEYYNYNNEKGALGEYEKPFITINDTKVDSAKPITGGKNATTFTELKDMLVYGHRQRLIPVSDTDISQFLVRNGYSSVKSLDFLPQNRLYRITKDLPIQEDKLFQDDGSTRINSSIGTYVGSLPTTIDELVGTGWVIDNGLRVTLLQRCVFDITDQTPYLTQKSEIDRLLASTNQAKIDMMNTRSMAFNPFAYVIDTTMSRAAIRAYLLNAPTIKYQTYRYQNTNLTIQAQIGKISITYSKTGYQLRVETSSNEDYKKLSDDAVGLQLSFKTVDSTSPATIKATMIGLAEDSGERVYVFDLGTTFDLNENSQLNLAGFRQFGKLQDEVRVDLSTIANFIFTYAAPNLILQSTSDFKIDQALFNTLSISIIETEYVVEFGKLLSSLYSRISPMVGSAQYKKYEQDVPKTYAATIYKTESVTGTNGTIIEKLVIDPDTNLPIVLHKQGETMYNPDGSVQIQFYKGNTVRDENNNPVPIEPRKMKYMLDFVGFDYKYLISQDEYDSDYVTKVETFFIDDVIAQLDEFNSILLDETRLLFKPRSTMGHSKTIINESVEKIMQTDLSFVVAYYMTDTGLKNLDLQDKLKKNTHTVANTLLKSNTVSNSDLIIGLKTDTTDVKNIKVTIFAGNEEIDLISNYDTTNGFTVQKLIDQSSDQFLTIKENIEIQFLPHKANNNY